MNHQLNIFDAVHIYENTPAMQVHLDENRVHFNNQCKKVFDLLMSGNTLTVVGGMLIHSISSLPRRVLDLKENGVQISDRWAETLNSKMKHWYMTQEQIEHNKKFIK